MRLHWCSLEGEGALLIKKADAKMDAGAGSARARLLVCPKCKQKFYDMTHGRCFACGYKGWGFYQAVKIKEAKQKK